MKTHRQADPSDVANTFLKFLLPFDIVLIIQPNKIDQRKIPVKILFSVYVFVAHPLALAFVKTALCLLNVPPVYIFRCCSYNSKRATPKTL